MIKSIIENKIQTALHSNVHQCQYGTVGASAGDNTITFAKKFLTKPVVIVNGTIKATAGSQPIVYLVSFNQDGNGYYESMVVYSDATATNIDWIAIGVVI